MKNTHLVFKIILGSSILVLLFLIIHRSDNFIKWNREDKIADSFYERATKTKDYSEFNRNCDSCFYHWSLMFLYMRKDRDNWFF